MNSIATKRLFSAVLGVLALASPTLAAPVVPTGLSVGDPYYLAFVTESGLAAGSSLIATYNNFVQSEAALNPALTGTGVGVTYKAIASTFAVGAIPNMGLSPGIPVYLLDGTTQVSTVDGTGWLGSTLLAPIGLTQYAVAPVATPPGYPFVWTGSDPPGNIAVNPLDGPFAPRMGTWFYSTTDWVSYSNTSLLAPLRFYGISSLLHVPAVPEPSTILLGSAFAVLAVRRGKRGFE